MFEKERERKSERVLDVKRLDRHLPDHLFLPVKDSPLKYSEEKLKIYLLVKFSYFITS